MKKIAVPKQILQALKRIKGARAFLLSGSRVLGKASKNADWDIYVMLKDGMPRWRKTWKVGGEWLEIFCNDRKQIEKEFAEDLKEGRGVTTYMFVTGQIIKDSPAHVLRKLQNKALANWKRGPRKLSKTDIGFIGYDIATYIQDIEDCLVEGEAAYLLMNYAVNEFVNYQFKLSGKWFPRPKERMQALKRKDAEMYRLVIGFNTTEDWRKKARLAIRMGKRVGKKFGLKSDGYLHLRPTKREPS